MNDKIKIAWYGKHFGEEPPLTGNEGAGPSTKFGAGPSARLGAGGIFFSGCNLRCVFCQNWQISQAGLGKEYSLAQLVGIMLELEKRGAVNIDLVTPTPWWQLVKAALKLAKAKGLKIPVIWNSNAFESAEIIKQLSGLVNIYLPDFKYGDDAVAEKYSKVKNYSAAAETAIREMIRQAGEENVIVRHLILPNNLKNSFKALAIIKKINPRVAVSLMRQYHPCFHSADYPEINRRLTDEEFNKVLNYQLELGLENGWAQAENCQENFLPDFTKSEPFA